MRRLPFIAVLIAALNVAALIFFPTHSLFKPLLYLSAAMLLAGVAGGVTDAPPEAAWSPNELTIALAIAALYAPTFFLDLSHNDWTHRGTSAGVTSLLHLFTARQQDGFYRPLGFLSLWIDYKIFRGHDWAYHLQNIALHIANALLLIRVGGGLGLDRVTARFAALLFAVAAVNYEPVMWPGARLDLMAALFTLLALLCLFEYLGQPGLWHGSLWLMLLCFAAGVLSKESAYCFPLLALLFAATLGKLSHAPPLSVGIQTVVSFFAAAIVAGLLVAIRLIVYGGLGGYLAADGTSIHSQLRLTTFTSFFTRALPVSLFALHVSAPLPGWVLAAVLGFALCACALALHASGSRRKHATLLIAALLSALPAANLVNWIGPVMHNTRYLYLTSVFIFMLVASAGERVRTWLAVLAVVNGIAAVYNYETFRWIDVWR